VKRDAGKYSYTSQNGNSYNCNIGEDGKISSLKSSNHKFLKQDELKSVMSEKGFAKSLKPKT
jgi:hypothetical protein